MKLIFFIQFTLLFFGILNADDYNLSDFDFIIIGCGTSGAVIASRLSENPNFKVACIERGPADYPNSEAWLGMKIPNNVYFFSPHDPIFFSPHESGKRAELLQRSMGIGGTSKVYGMIYVRPHPDALNSWPKGWQYDDLFPYFKKVEDHYCYYDKNSGITKEECEKYHGKNGPLQVNGMEVESFHHLSKAFKQLCEDISQPWNGYSADYNGDLDKFTSCSLLQQYKDRLNRTDPNSPYSRGNSKSGYMKQNVLDRKNLAIFVDSVVTRIIFNEDKRAVAVEFFHPISNSVKRLNARKEVILSAGVFHTPQILQVSGVGDPELLKRINVPLIVNNTHVGKHLWDHIGAKYIVQLNACDQTFSPANGPFSWLVSYNSGVRQDISKNFRDIQLSMLDMDDGRTTALTKLSMGRSKTSRCDNTTGTIATIRITLNFNDFRHGTVEATTSSIMDRPMINLGWRRLSQTDRDTFKSAIELLRQHAMDKTTSFGQIIATEIAPGNQDLDEYLDNDITSALHPVGTCGMGRCIDENLNVIGTKGLKVCDASSFASQIDGNPSATIYAMAELLSDRLKKQYLNDSVEGKWSLLDNLLIYKSNNVLPRKKIAAFDINILSKLSTIELNKKFDDLYTDGYNIVLFSNNTSLCGQQQQQVDTYKNELLSMIEQINSPVQIYVSICENDNYLDLIWNRFTWLDNNCVDIDYKSSFYVVGDSSQRINFSFFKHFDVSQSVKINRPADDVWGVVGDFYKIHTWHPLIIATKTDSPNRRQVVFEGQYVDTVEQLVYYSPDEYTYKYKNVGGNWGKNLRSYVSTLRVLSDDNGQSSIVIWSGSYDGIDEYGLTQFYRKGLDSLLSILSPDPCLSIENDFKNNLSKFKNSNLYVYWRQDYNITATELWKYAGNWKGTKNGVLSYEPGAEHSFTLPNMPKIYERLVHYDSDNLEFYYCMRVTNPRSLPVLNYLSMKKVVETSDTTSAWIRTGQMITDGSKTVDTTAYQVLNNVYVAGGERLRVQLSKMSNQ